ASSKKESRLRSSVSRAYYAAFCSARNHAGSNGYQIKNTAADHYGVEKFYSNRVISYPQVGTNLSRLRVARNMCDYDETVKGLSSKTRLSIMQAESILSITT